MEEHLRAIKEAGASIYGISFTSFSASVAFNLIRRVKRDYPSVTVVIGGAHVMTHAESALRLSGADICVIGEGEITFAEIVCRYAELPDALSSIAGIAYIEDGKFKRTWPRHFIEDINSIPFPARDLINQDEYVGISYSKARPNTEVVITRGCPLRCVFCANPVYRLEGAIKFRARSPENIAEEVEELYRMGYREIFFHSDELNVRLGWSIELCRALAALGHDDLHFQCNMRVVPMNEKLAYWMRRANFWLVRVGIESANIRVLMGIKKRMSLEKTERACEMWAKHGIRVFAYLMMFNFWEEDGVLQHETPDEVRNTLSFVYRLWRQGKINYSCWQFAVPTPGAELYDIAVRHGMIDDTYLPDDKWQTFDHLQGVSRREFNSLYRRARFQSALMAVTAGNVEWRNWRLILNKARTLMSGLPT
jgi:anaerobic magnesium-protoporphyrin IX monomethyl ester cyclase